MVSDLNKTNMDRVITFKEVRKHRKQDSVWIVIHDEVYDVTAYLEEHPGGETILLDYAGEDGSQAFEDFGHSQDAREIMKKYKIGILAPEEKTSFLEECSKLKWAVLALAGAVVIGFALKKYLNK
ncbi:cytochrome b5-like isoform X1 [Colias croceus]|uniref:cytochrome b5-like isoform X1 n=1 Tax=Colias crocea TaxID=72248 RepID=UPI001E2805E9|nr:cytochrome b5-like isoform X1 [Colias croceus]